MKDEVKEHVDAFNWEGVSGPRSAYGLTLHSLARRLITNVLLDARFKNANGDLRPIPP